MLQGKTILVTGASSGIGAAIAQLLSENEAKLVLTARHEERLRTVYSKLNGNGHSFIFADLIVTKDVDELINEVPQLDGIVFTAGYNEYMPFKFISNEKADKIFQTNYFSSIFLLQKLLKKKLIKKGASLVFISSISAVLGVPATTLYAASKAAINSTVKVLATELAPQKIRANAICPGIVLTPMLNQDKIDTSSLKEQEKQYPLGFGTPDDVANAVVFHLSDKSKWLTGNIMNLDGGFSLQ